MYDISQFSCMRYRLYCKQGVAVDGLDQPLPVCSPQIQKEICQYISVMDTLDLLIF
jgi:hypothetical protein